MITRKAAVGFLLLAAIVFLTTYYWSPAPTQTVQSSGTIQHQTLFPTISREPVYQYRLPLVQFKEKWQAPLAATIVMELFALICYLGLKKLEPVINRAAEKAMRDLREQNERTQEEYENKTG